MRAGRRAILRPLLVSAVIVLRNHGRGNVKSVKVVQSSSGSAPKISTSRSPDPNSWIPGLSQGGETQGAVLEDSPRPLCELSSGGRCNVRGFGAEAEEEDEDRDGGIWTFLQVSLCRDLHLHGLLVDHQRGSAWDGRAHPTCPRCQPATRGQQTTWWKEQ